MTCLRNQVSFSPPQLHQQSMSWLIFRLAGRQQRQACQHGNSQSNHNMNYSKKLCVTSRICSTVILSMNKTNGTQMEPPEAFNSIILMLLHTEKVSTQGLSRKYCTCLFFSFKILLAKKHHMPRPPASFKTLSFLTSFFLPLILPVGF